MVHVLADNLRQAVLQAAMQGKLTKQLKTDTSVQFTLSNIQKEKEQLIINKLIKKEKELSSVEENEIPFDIPTCWKWKRLGEVTLTNIGLTYHPQDVSNEGTLVLRSSNIKNGRISYSDNVYVSMEIPESSKIHKGDILICVRNGSRKLVGKAAIVDKEGMAFGAFMAKIHTKWVNPNYVKYYLSSHTFRGALDDVKTETINQITQTMLKNKVIPIPPIEEQQRIVDRVGELMAKIDEYEKLENQLVQLKEQFPKDMRDSLLQAGMRGRLTNQLTSDTSVETTLESIEREKRQLIKDKKSKKTKQSTEDYDEEVLFDVPSSWKWVKFGDLFSHVAGKALNSKNTTGTKAQYLTTSNVYENHFELENLKEMYYTEEEMEKYSVKRGDLLVLEGGDTGRSAIWPFDKSYCIQNHLHRCRPYGNINVPFYLQVLRFLKSTGVIKGKGIAIQGLSANVLHNILVPLPPIEEQQRIVDKLDEMLLLVDSLAQMD